ncbi:Rho GTPase activation protein [Gilbertella persicaria]|uniref:Rho GTPase activation protein n=1 Tax=Gilbertella persicaria TaxID=101096 RepID=UPI00221EFC00|nr:Rho GTPase activation protein [Gilbertella persicaria]KAI8055566.1 Rho GTPase activation protein [Gilbertella persicaria]
MAKVLALSSRSPEYKAIAGLNIIYEAGLDRESRPILVLCADNLPNPDIYDYDLILSFILARLDEFVENDYVLVFFSSPARYRPGWLWLLKAYRSLDRKYKKNLKALYVVHLTRMYRLVFDFANKIISPKFARKLRYLSTLEQLKEHVVLAPQFIPQRVIEYDQQLPAIYQPPKPVQPQKRTVPSLAFGRKLEDLAAMEGNTSNDYIPSFVVQIVNHLKEHGLDKEGIFRKSPASDELQAVKNALNQGEPVDLTQHDIDVSAALLKVFIRELPIPLISLKFSEDMGALPDASICTQGTIDKIKNKLSAQYKNSPNYLSLLKYLCEFLKQVSDHSIKNRMNTHNLSVVFTPNMIRAEQVNASRYVNMHETEQAALADAAVYLKQMNQGMQLVQLLITKHQDIFI